MNVLRRIYNNSTRPASPPPRKTLVLSHDHTRSFWAPAIQKKSLQEEQGLKLKGRIEDVVSLQKNKARADAVLSSCISKIRQVMVIGAVKEAPMPMPREMLIPFREDPSTVLKADVDMVVKPPKTELEVEVKLPKVEVELEIDPKLKLAQGVAQGAAGPVVLTPVDTRQQQVTTLKPGEKKPPFRKAFTNYGKLVGISIPSKILGSAIYMLSLSPSTKLVQAMTDNKFVIGVVPYGISSVVESAFTAPIANINYRLREGSKMTPLDAAKNIYKESGKRGFYRGNGPTLVASVVYNMIFFPGSKMLNKHISKEDQNISKGEKLIKGFISGFSMSAAAVPITYPFYRVIMEQRSQRIGTDNPPLSFFKTCSKMRNAAMQRGGPLEVLKEFEKGVGMSIGRMALGGGVIIAANEGVKALYDRSSKQDL